MGFDFKRGVGIHEWLNWAPIQKDGSYRWPPYRSVEDWLAGSRPLTDWPKGDPFERIRGLGFDFVRLTVDPGPLLATNGVKQRQALDILAQAVRRINSAGLGVVFNLHGVSQVPAYDMDILYDGAESDGVMQYRRMVRAVAAMLAELKTSEIAFEPYNEPAYYPCDASGTEDWQRIMAATVSDIRSVARDLTIIATGACGGSITGLTDLDPTFDDSKVLYSFHMYEPHSFTHQKSENGDNFKSGLPWPALTGSAQSVREGLRLHMQAAGLSEMEQQANLDQLATDIDLYFRENWSVGILQRRIGEAVGWARKHNIPATRLFMGEFGVMRLSSDGRSGAYDVDRLTYLQAARTTAEGFGMPWSVWEYSNPHGMTVIEPVGQAVPDQDLLKALGLAVR
jgi:hypothetical protein